MNNYIEIVTDKLNISADSGNELVEAAIQQYGMMKFYGDTIGAVFLALAAIAVFVFGVFAASKYKESSYDVIRYIGVCSFVALVVLGFAATLVSYAAGWYFTPDAMMLNLFLNED